ncbi:MAG: ester cyclase [Chloroflexi bacterium]|nr:ester cyclase [Chloroflexota bacterium]
MSPEENKTIVRRLIEEGFNQGNERVIEELVASDYTSHEEETPRQIGIEGFKELVGSFRAAFPDARFVIEHTVAEGDKVVTWGYFTGTHRGPLEGIPPTGKSVRVKDVDLYRLRDGKVAEAWTHVDQLGMMQQLGALSMPREGG